MLATMTLVVCLNSAPQVCELLELRLDALLCQHGARNTALTHVPEGYRLRWARCVPANQSTQPGPVA